MASTKVYDWQCINCPWYKGKCTNYNEENSFCLWDDIDQQTEEEETNEFNPLKKI